MTFPVKVFVAICNLGQSDSQYGAMEMMRLEVSLTGSPSSFSFVTLGKFLSLPVPEGVAPEVAQPLLMPTFHDSLGRLQF